MLLSFFNRALTKVPSFSALLWFNIFVV